MDSSPGPDAKLIDFAGAYCRARGIGDALMRKQRLSWRSGYIACTRLVMAQELEQQLGQRQPHW